MRPAGDGPPAGSRARPALHFAPARNWMNDPNGLIQRDGRVHLFYQHNPGGLVLEQMAWGHASSPDLWRWTDHPLALQPSPDGPDRDGCWSGCAVVHDGVPHLIYTGLRGQLTLPCLATAEDAGLVRWSRSAHSPVIDRWPPEPGVVAFRDHTAWRSGPAWYQVIGGGLADRGGALFLYRSRDLRRWQYLGVFAAAADHGLPGAIWECPDVFTLGDASVVVVSVAADGPPRAIWMTGQIAGNRFRPAASGPCDGGDRYYAPQSLPLADGRRIAFGWLRESLGELTGQDRTRVGAMSLPRELFLQAGTLRSRPAGELDRARGPELESQVIEARGELGVQLTARAARATELQVAPVRGPVGAVALRLRGAGCRDVEITVRPGHIQVRAGEQELSTQIPAAGAARAPALAEPVRVYYDAGLLEVFGPDTSPVAVCCDRDGRYDRVMVDVSPAPGQQQAAVRVTGWPAG